MCLTVKLCVMDRVEYSYFWLQHFWTLDIFILMLGCPTAVQQRFLHVKPMPGGQLNLWSGSTGRSLWCTLKADLFVQLFFIVVKWISFLSGVKNNNGLSFILQVLHKIKIKNKKYIYVYLLL